MTRFPFIAIEGVIGVGKTTLARMLAPDLAASRCWKCLKKTHSSAISTAIAPATPFRRKSFPLSRYRQQHQAVRNALTRGPLFSDYTFAKDSLFAHLNLSGDELTVYEKLHSALAEKIPTPDLLIYLRADLDTLMARIAMRDRPYERNRSQLHRQSAAGVRRFLHGLHRLDVLVIDTNNLNIVVDARLCRCARAHPSALGGTFQQTCCKFRLRPPRRKRLRWRPSAVRPDRCATSPRSPSRWGLGAILSDGADRTCVKRWRFASVV